MGYFRDEEFIRAFGRRIREIRNSKKMSMEDLAHVAGFSYSKIARIELGESNTSISAAKKLAECLEVEVWELFRFEY